jgi:epoxyqueuosine reductase
VLDARRCISYLTIEHTGVIPLEHRASIGTRVFGCDVCQDVCPFNASTAARPSESELSPRADLAPVDLIGLLELSSAGYRKLVKRTALRRTSRETLARNAAIALGNCRSVEAEAPLARALSGHAAPIVRGHAAWALGELCAALGGLCELSLRALDEAERGDTDGWVRDEATLARKRLGGS